eukprot:c27192_g1_i2 orf=268-1407(+)
MEGKETWKVAEKRTQSQRGKRVLTDRTQKHLEQLTKQARALAGEDLSEQEDFSWKTISARLASLQQRHTQLQEKMMSGSEKLADAQLRQEFADAQAEGTPVCDLEGEAWNDGVIATLREQVHREIEVSAQEGSNATNSNGISRQHDCKIVYRVSGKIICGLKGGRIGIQFNTSLSGDSIESYYCVLASRSFLEKMYVSEHTIPFFVPLRETERSHLSSSAVKFIDCVGDILQSFVSRREQVRLFKQMKGNLLRHFYHSLPHTLIEFLLEEPNCKVTVSLAYDDLKSPFPTRSKVLAWPLVSAKILNRFCRKGNKAGSSHATSYHLLYAEEALKSKLLHQDCIHPAAYDEILTDLRATLGHLLPSVAVMPIPSGATVEKV